MMLQHIFAFAIALLLSFLAVPAIIRISYEKALIDKPDGNRKLHTSSIPTLGGIAIFIGTLFSFSSFVDYMKAETIFFLTPSLLLLFFAGIIDDISNIRASKKLLVQIICSFFVVFFGKLQITNFWGMFGINEIPPAIGLIISILLITSLTNAYNLIDGINGLAGTLGVLASGILAMWFYLNDQYSYSILAISLAGSLIGFLYYNFNKATIFMGDTGSMLIGFLISILLIKFIESNRVFVSEGAYYIKAAPAVAFAYVSVPLLDMIRVFFTRILSKKHPFTPDRQHIHHMLLDYGISHRRAAILITSINTFLILIAYAFKNLRSLEVSIILIVIYSGIMVLIKKYKN